MEWTHFWSAGQCVGAVVWSWHCRWSRRNSCAPTCGPVCPAGRWRPPKRSSKANCRLLCLCRDCGTACPRHASRTAPGFGPSRHPLPYESNVTNHRQDGEMFDISNRISSSSFIISFNIIDPLFFLFSRSPISSRLSNNSQRLHLFHQPLN